MRVINNEDILFASSDHRIRIYDKNLVRKKVIRIFSEGIRAVLNTP
jgi:hypothetical protein